MKIRKIKKDINRYIKKFETEMQKSSVDVEAEEQNYPLPFDETITTIVDLDTTDEEDQL